MKNFIFSIQNDCLKISVRPTFAAKKSFPEMFFYVWDNEITVKNITNLPVYIKEMEWRAVDVMGRNVPLENSFENDYIQPQSELKFNKTASLSAPAGIILGRLCIKADDGEDFISKMPTVALDSPFHDFIKN